MNGNNIHCVYDKLVPIGRLKPHPKNPHVHPEDQIEKLAKLIETHGWRVPIAVSKLSGYVIRGHARLEAARILKEKRIPVDYQDYDGEDRELQDLMADTIIAELGALDDKKMAENVKFLQEFEAFDPSSLAFDWSDVERLKELTFLDDLAGDGTAGGGQEQERRKAELVAVSFVMTEEQRKVILEAIGRAKENFGLTTGSEAIVEICRAFRS